MAKRALPTAKDPLINWATSIPAWLDLPEPRGFRPKRKLRTVWISDLHLGTRGCNAAMLLDFLASIECETLYLVGDIVDGWRLSKGWYWPDAHNEVVRRVLENGASRHPRGADRGQSRRNAASLCGDELWRCRTRARCDPHDRRWPPPADHAWRRVRRGSALCPLARLCGRPGLRIPAAHQPLGQYDPPPVQTAVLVAVGLHEKARQERGAIRVRFRRSSGARGARHGRRRGGLRPYPLRRNPPDRRRDVLQRR